MVTPVQDQLFDAVHVAKVDESWWHSAHDALAWMAATGEPFDAYTITSLGVPDPDEPNRWGALFRAAYTEGLIEPVGFRTSRRRTRAGGVCRVWVGTAAAAA